MATGMSAARVQMPSKPGGNHNTTGRSWQHTLPVTSNDTLTVREAIGENKVRGEDLLPFLDKLGLNRPSLK